MYAARGGDDGFSYLTPDRYVEVRLGDQLNYFKKKAVQIERQLKALYWLTFIVGGVGTYLAATNQQVWIALTTALVAAIGTYLGYRQTENTLMKYNQAATDLANVKTWWNALSAEEQSVQENIDSLVEHTEQVLQSELDGWVQQMQNALAELRKGQEPAPEREENRERQGPVPPPNREPSKDQAGTAGEPAKGKADTSAETDGHQPTGNGGSTESKPAPNGTSAPTGNVGESSGTESEASAEGDAGTNASPPINRKDDNP
jgi:FtsZ-binding cell division protein ZapB